MFERTKAKWRENSEPRDVTFTLPAGSARDIYAFHAYFGRLDGSLIWLGLIIGLFGAWAAIFGALLSEGENLQIMLAAAIIGLACLISLETIPWWVRRQMQA